MTFRQLPIPRRKVALAVAGALTLAAFSGQAAASVYGGSRLLIQNLDVEVVDSDGDEVFTAAGNFQFTENITAALNGAAAPPQSETCFGEPGTPPGPNNCNAAQPRLDAQPANAPGGGVTRTNNDYSYFGPGLSEYANSDSVIDSAELTLDDFTFTRQIAEAELQTGDTANANAEIQSTTQLSLTGLSVPPGGTVELSFEADPDLLAHIFQGAGFAGGNTQANINMTFGLTRTTGGGGEVSWAPQGTGATNDCTVGPALALAGVTCVETADGEDLNRTIAVSTNNSSSSFSRANNVFSNFGAEITGLPAGAYSLSLNALTSTSMNQSFAPPPPPPPPPVPAAGVGLLSLLGMGLAGIGAARLRRRR